MACSCSSRRRSRRCSTSSATTSACLDIHHDIFASEAELQASGKVDEAMDNLRSKGLVYEGELERPKSLDQHDEWEPVELTLFKSSQFGDDQDRPMKKSDGSWTYFGADAAYHLQKAQSGRSSGQHLGRRPCGDGQARPGGGQGADRRPRRPGRQDHPDGQAVPRRRADQDVASASGNFVTLADVVREVGKDVVRFMMLTKRADTPLDFDFAKVVEASKDNPVFYVQYAHARISSLQRKAAEAGVVARKLRRTLACSTPRNWRWSSSPPNIRASWKAAAMAHEPHRVAFYLYDLAAAFHALVEPRQRRS